MREPIHLFINTPLLMDARITYEFVHLHNVSTINSNRLSVGILYLGIITLRASKFFVSRRKLKFKKEISVTNKTT